MTLRTIPVLAAFVFSSGAAASGFQLLEENASGIGNAYAGSAAVADNASTVFFNPAGMTRLQSREISVGVAAVRPSFKFSDQGSTVPAGSVGGNGGDAGDVNLVPNGYLSFAVSDDLYLGVGISAPFGLSIEYEPDWAGRFQTISFDVKTYNVNPSMAYRVNDAVSVGFGVNWQRLEAEYVRQATPTETVRLKADDDAWGWNAGALLQVSPSTRVGVSYRSKTEYSLDGDLRGALNIAAQADLELPDTLILSVTEAINDRWEVLGDISWTGWSSIDTVNIVAKNSGAVVQPLDAKFDDTWRIALGANYKYDDAWTLRGGVAFDQTPVPDAQHRLTALPDKDRVWFTVGAQWKLTKTSWLDFGAAYLHLKDADINNDQSPTRGVVKGHYDPSVYLIGAQYSVSF